MRLEFLNENPIERINKLSNLLSNKLSIFSQNVLPTMTFLIQASRCNRITLLIK